MIEEQVSKAQTKTQNNDDIDETLKPRDSLGRDVRIISDRKDDTEVQEMRLSPGKAEDDGPGEDER